MIKEFGYEYSASCQSFEVPPESLLTTTSRHPWGALPFQSGRDALKAIAREYSPTMVLLPALSCDSMRVPFVLHGHNVQYYRITKEYAVDFGHLKTLISDSTQPILFLYLNYFGKTAANPVELQELRDSFPNLVFIEDKTQVFIHACPSFFQPDFTVVSIRKWLAIPDGGLLWTALPLKNQFFGEDTFFAQRRRHAQLLREKYLNSGDINLKIEFRHIFSSISEILDKSPVPIKMSKYAYDMLLNVAQDIIGGGISQKRIKNSACLADILQESKIQLLQSQAGLSDLYVPFLTANRDAVQRALSAEGIFCTIIWPLSQEQRDLCPIAKRTEQFMLAAPCDQRYSSSDMEYIGNAIVRTVAKLGGAVA